MSRIKIIVTNKDIEHGGKGSFKDCPITLAGARKGVRLSCYVLPDEVWEFIFAFDKGEKVKPFSFYLDT